MSWLPANFFVPEAPAPGLRSDRPVGQGDVFVDVPVAAGKTRIHNGQPQATAKIETAIVISSSCGMRKGQAGTLNPTVQVAVVKRLQSIAPGWADPWTGHLHALPLLGVDEAEPRAANLAQTGPCSTEYLTPEHRVACVSEEGMLALKARLSGYFIRTEVPSGTIAVAAAEEWHELTLWERWVSSEGSEAGFQEWLDQPNPNYPDRSRRASLYQDLVGIQQQLDDRLG